MLLIDFSDIISVIIKQSMFRTDRIVRYFSAALIKKLSWRQYFNSVEMLIYLPQVSKHMVYLMGEEVTFAELQTKQPFKNIQFTFPKQIDPASTKVIDFFVSEPRALTVQATYLDQVHQLSNRRQEKDCAALIRGLQNQKGIYRQINFESMELGLVRKFLTIYYLKLEAEGYCRLRNYPLKTAMTSSLREEILQHLNMRNQTSQRTVINDLINLRQQVLTRIFRTTNQIQQIQEEADRAMRMYKLGVAALTVAHLGGFGYMIFGVEWLGWDIIEPLTFSVSTLYLLLALRFYRKHQKDRSANSIRERLRELGLRPDKRMLISSLRVKHEQELQELKELDLSLKLAHNKLALSSTLVATV